MKASLSAEAQISSSFLGSRQWWNHSICWYPLLSIFILASFSTSWSESFDLKMSSLSIFSRSLLLYSPFYLRLNSIEKPALFSFSCPCYSNESSLLYLFNFFSFLFYQKKLLKNDWKYCSFFSFASFKNLEKYHLVLKIWEIFYLFFWNSEEENFLKSRKYYLVMSTLDRKPWLISF